MAMVLPARCILAVAPFTGAWIEIRHVPYHSGSFIVAPFTGAWIEIKDPPSITVQRPGRSLHGSVD